MQPLLQWNSNQYYTTWVCVCSIRYPVWNAHAPWCHLWPAPFTFPILSHKRYDLKKKRIIGHKMCPSIFSTNLCETFFHCKRNCARYDLMSTGLQVKCRLFLSDFNDSWIFLKRFSKNNLIIHFYENPSSGSRVVPCGRTDGHNCRFSQFCWRA